MDKLILIDDGGDVEALLRRVFDPLHLRLMVFHTAEDALVNVAKIKPAAIILAFKTGGGEGLESIQNLLRTNNQQLLILIATPENASVARQALKEGVHCALLRPLDVGIFKREVEATLMAARDMRRTVSYEPISEEEEYDEVLAGRSQSMRAFFHQVQEAAQNDAPILLTGAEGSGKSLLARAIHQHSARKNELFLTINCARPSLNSELFGREEKLAANDALTADRWEQCRSGTLVLDDITAMPQEVQARLQEVLCAEGKGAGGSDTRSTLSARIIMTTRNSIDEVALTSGTCQELWARLKPLSLEIPPLSARAGDIRLLTDYFLKRISPDSSIAKSFSEDSLRIFESYSWPGNVRELEENVRRIAAVASIGTIQLEDLPRHLVTASSAPPCTEMFPNRRSTDTVKDWATISRTLFQWSRRDTKLKIVPAIERHLIRYALLETKGSQVRAAKLLGMSRSTLRKRIDQLQIKQTLIFG